MNEKRLFNYLKRQPKAALLTLLWRAYDEMSVEQKYNVFGAILREAPALPVNRKDLLKRIKTFHADSLAGEYYAPFDINSKNFMYIPEETKEWFETLGDLLEECARLTEEGDHPSAVKGFDLLYDLVGQMENGEEIVFADEYGSWMITADEKKCIAAYLTSLSVIANPEAYTKTALRLIRRDGLQSFSDKVYESAVRVATEEQRAYLKAEIERRNIRTAPMR